MHDILQSIIANAFFVIISGSKKKIDLENHHCRQQRYSTNQMSRTKSSTTMIGSGVRSSLIDLAIDPSGPRVLSCGMMVAGDQC